jgi:transposase-like protein
MSRGRTPDPNILSDCPACGAQFITKQWRIRRADGKPICCSGGCARKLLFANGYTPPNKKPPSAVAVARQLYTRTGQTIESIAAAVGVDRVTVCRWARDGRWTKFKREASARTKYRKAATSMIGRPLARGEHVHHVNGDIHDNDHGNLFVYATAADHAAAHGSLERCAFALLSQGLIVFNRAIGRYELA